RDRRQVRCGTIGVRGEMSRMTSSEAGVRIVCPPPAHAGALHAVPLHAQPRGAGGDGVAGLLRALEDLLDAPLALGVAPRVEQAADGVDSKHVLQREGDLRPHDLAERKVANWILHVQSSTLPARQKACNGADAFSNRTA